MPKSSTLSEQYDNFIDNNVKQIFKKVAQGKNLKLAYIDNTRKDNSYLNVLSFNAVGTESRLELSDDGRSIKISIAPDQSFKFNDSYSDETQSRFYRFIIQQYLSDISHSDKKPNALEVEELIERFRGYKNRPEFSQLSITNITERSPTELTIDETLDFIRRKNESINSAKAEIGTVSSGSGLMPHQMPKFSREEYLSFIDSTFTKALKGFGNKLGLIKISSGQEYEFATIGGFIIAEANSDNNGKRKILMLSTHKQDCGKDAACIKIGSLKLANNSWDILDIKNAFDTYQEIKKLEYRNNEKVYLKSIAKSIFYSIFFKNNNKIGENGVCHFNKKEFIKYIQSSTDNLHSICRTDATTLPSKTSITTTSPLQHNLNLTQAAAGFTIFSTILASLLTNTTTPAIGYNSSTDTSIVNATSRPEQDVDEDGISKGTIAGIVGAGVTILCFIGYCCYQRNIRHSGEYNVEQRERSCDIDHESGDYKKLEDINDNVGNKCATLPTIAERQEENEQGAVAEEGTSSVTIETEPLLPNNNQPSAPTSGGKEISDVDMANVQKALRGEWLPDSSKSTAKNDGSQNFQCSGAGAAAGSQGMPMSQRQLDSKFDEILILNNGSSDEVKSEQDWYGQQGEKADATYKELRPAVQKRRPSSNEVVSPLLEGMQVEGSIQPAPSR